MADPGDFDNSEQELSAGATAWRQGHLVEAQAAYRRMLEHQPNDWRAMFQLAWLDAAFGQLPPAQARALDRSGISDEARRLVRVLIAQTESGKFLDGAAQDWDIETLERDGAARDDEWWLDRGKRAWTVGLYGLAHECYERAARRSNILYDDVPNWAQGALTQADRHLEAVKNGVP